MQVWMPAQAQTKPQGDPSWNSPLLANLVQTCVQLFCPTWILQAAWDYLPKEEEEWFHEALGHCGLNQFSRRSGEDSILTFSTSKNLLDFSAYMWISTKSLLQDWKSTTQYEGGNIYFAHMN